MISGGITLEGCTIEVAYAPLDVSFQELSFAEGALSEEMLYDLTTQTDTEHGTTLIQLDLASELTIPEEQTKLFDIVLFLGGGLQAGTVLDASFASDPELFTPDGPVTVFGDNGSLTIPNDNFLLIEPAWAHPGQKNIPVYLNVFNKDKLQGLQVSCSFDPEMIHVADITQEDTLTEALDCEFFQPVISNDNGFFIIGILLDDTPPVSKLYPTTGYPLKAAILHIDVQEDVPAPSEAVIAFEDGLGTPAINNRVVVNSESIVPQTINGVVAVNTLPEFIRGDVNSDGRFDIADPVMMLLWKFYGQPIDCVKAADADDNGEVGINDALFLMHFFFRNGDIIPPPFPEPGTDPTLDTLSCENPNF